MQVKSIAECSKRAFCNTFDFIKLPFVIKNFVLSIFEWPLKTGFTVLFILKQSRFRSADIVGVDQVLTTLTQGINNQV